MSTAPAAADSGGAVAAGAASTRGSTRGSVGWAAAAESHAGPAAGGADSRARAGPESGRATAASAAQVGARAAAGGASGRSAPPDSKKAVTSAMLHDSISSSIGMSSARHSAWTAATSDNSIVPPKAAHKATCMDYFRKAATIFFSDLVWLKTIVKFVGFGAWRDGEGEEGRTN
eukprot:scaffold18424_cov119-Isochrysis_galbana.AAC.4